MNRRLHRTVPAFVVLVAVGLAGCSDSDDSPDGPDGPDATGSTDTASASTPAQDDSSASTGTAGAGPCGVITDARLSELTGRPQTVGDLTTIGRRQECRTVRDADDAVSVTWGFEQVQDDDPEYVIDSESFGLDQGRVDLRTNGTTVPAFLLTGEEAGAPTVKVVVTIGDQVLVAAATDLESAVGGEGAPVDVLRRVAVGIAEDYLEEGIPATSAG